MSKRLLPLFTALVLFGCAQSVDQKSTDLAKQPSTSTFPALLNRSTVIESNKPRDFTEFSKQSEMVVKNSASMAKIYQLSMKS